MTQRFSKVENMSVSSSKWIFLIREMRSRKQEAQIKQNYSLPTENEPKAMMSIGLLFFKNIKQLYINSYFYENIDNINNFMI